MSAGAAPVHPPESAAARDVVDALWLRTLGRICGRAAHELKGALNGVSVNVEVVRSRAAKPDVPASNVSKFAETASSQLDAVIDMSDALLGLVRPAPEPVDVGLQVRRIVSLLAPVARIDGRRLDAEGTFEELGRTSAPGSAVRAAIGECLLAAIEQSLHVRCSVVRDGEGCRLAVESGDGTSVTVDASVADHVHDAAIRIEAESSAIFISFPHSAGSATENV